MTVCIKKFLSKKGNQCVCLCLTVGGRDFLFFDKGNKNLMSLLNLSPVDFYELPEGEYQIVEKK